MKKRLLGIILALLIVLMLLPAISYANSSYTDWTDATTLPTKEGAYKLTKDVTITGQVIIRTGTTVTIDLNGYTLNFDGNSAKYLVQHKGRLIIEDSSKEGTGLMINNGNSYIIHTYGDCQINGGTIQSTTTSGRAVFVQRFKRVQNRNY